MALKCFHGDESGCIGALCHFGDEAVTFMSAMCRP